ncbi:allergen Tab y 5.0101 [Drosophila teissieri]|uniref:allergen Tab y 5.0101 n=1 Tax=Drosophila teissieri TaxID=7243 RepID=UPI001CBA10F0|nr:allergen Tab y 5.0101 [Drosophila teissieri]XP_043653759.1 allergen Tab y 5.0101 [Drosophila teissieri]
MELSRFVFVALLHFLPFECSKLVDYCQLSYCGANNLACNNPSKFSVMCPPNARTLSMSTYRNLLLSAFNEFRNFTASGRLKYLQAAAARMSRLSYSVELESLARLAVITCSAHKFCLSSPEFYYVGTNTGSTSYLGSLNDYEDLELMLRTIQDWTRYADYINIKMGLYMPTTLEKRDIAKALLLMADRNTHVGCSAMRFTVDFVHNFIFLCAFSTDLLVERPIYRMSTKPGTACQRLDATYSALCAAGENYDNNKPVANARVFQLPLDMSIGRQAYVPAT